MKAFGKIACILVLIAAAGALFWLFNYQKEENEVFVSEMEAIATSLEETFLTNKDTISHEPELDMYGAEAWFDILSKVEADDLKAVNPLSFTECALSIKNGKAASRYKVFQYETERVDRWGNPYLISVIDCNGYGPSEYAIVIHSAGQDGKFFEYPEDWSEREAIRLLEPDDIAYVSQVDGNYDFSHVEYKTHRNARVGYEELLVGERQTA